jgi:hypothetical protein
MCRVECSAAYCADTALLAMSASLSEQSVQTVGSVAQLGDDSMDKGDTGMQLRLPRRAALMGVIVLAIIAIVGMLAARTFVAPPKAHAAGAPNNTPLCLQRPQMCTETAEPWNANGQYTGHDEPSVLYYSNTPGSGNSAVSLLKLPTDPGPAPKQNGTGSVWNFQLHPAFWYGMAMCDDQDAPNPGVTCTPDSDQNIFTSTDPTSPKYLGLTPGTAFMEMQFYPPGWGPVSCTDANGNQDGKWCAAMTIDSVQSNSNTGTPNNAACNNLLGPEPVNWAMITKSGHPVAPARPDTGFGNQAIVTSDSLEFNNGDQLVVDMHDTTAGFQVNIVDLTTHQHGSMTASTANGFGHALFQPSASSCTLVNYAYHPMYSTSSPDTRVLWAAHSYNVAFSDEIGHFEYCDNIAAFDCTAGSANATDPAPAGADGDEFPCFNAPVINSHGAVISKSLGGCLGTDVDFDGAQYSSTAWPGGAGAVAGKVSTPIQFTSPLFTSGGHLRNYDRVAFETDLPRIEFATNPPCQRHVSNPADPSPGAGCVNPPLGPNGAAVFYPLFSTTNSHGVCLWQEGGASIPGTTNNFGGSSTSEFGSLLLSPYPATGFKITERYNNFRQVLNHNPCSVGGGFDGHEGI